MATHSSLPKGKIEFCKRKGCCPFLEVSPDGSTVSIINEDKGMEGKITMSREQFKDLQRCKI